MGKRLRESDFKGDKKLAAVIGAAIKTMEKAIISATASNQKLMKLSIRAFKKCKLKMWKNYGRAAPYEKRYWQLKTIYPKCIRAENRLKLQRLKVWKVYKKARDMYVNYRRLLKIQGRRCGNVCSNHKKRKLSRATAKIGSILQQMQEKNEALDKERETGQKALCQTVQKTLH